MGSPDLVESQATLAAVASSAQMISLNRKRLMKSCGRRAALRCPNQDERHAKDWITDWRRRNSPQHQSTYRFIQQRISSLPETVNASYARVIIDRSIHRELDYLVPETFADRVSIGSR